MSAPDRNWPSLQLMRHIEQTSLPRNVGALLEESAARHPDKTLFNFFDDNDQLSYGDVVELVRRVAAGLRRLGVNKGTHVGLMVPTTRLYPLAWLALARLGAVTIPINYNYTPRELDYMLRDGEARFLVIHRDYLATFECIEGGSNLSPEDLIVAGGALERYPNDWEQLSGAPEDSTLPDVDHDDLMNIQYTSGTTGMPKGALHTQRFWLGFGRVGAAQFLDKPKRLLLSQPFYYLDGQWFCLMTLFLGGTAFVARRMRASLFRRWLIDHRIEICNFPEIVSKQPPRDDDYMPHLIALSCYSHQLHNYRKYESRYGGKARQGFSMTELGCALFVPLEADERTGTGTVGVPVAFREAMVAAADGQEVGAGEVGELCVRGPGIFAGYFNQPEATAAAFHADWFRTGDLACRDETGWFYYLGRLKDRVRRSGENISAVEVEGVLRGVDGVMEAAVLPVPDELRGEEVKAYLLPAPGSDADTGFVHRVIAHCEKNLAPFKIPRYLEIVDAFPRTPSQKIRKSELIAAKADLRIGAYDRVDDVWR